jgi:putative peptide zinc metalloprotease protein
MAEGAWRMALQVKPLQMMGPPPLGGAILRDDLKIYPGPFSDGAPSWVVEDPVGLKFYRIGPVEYEIIKRVHTTEIIESIHAETTMRVDEELVRETIEWLQHNGLLRMSPKGMADMVKKTRSGIFHWLLHNYISFRLPLVKPDPWIGNLARAMSFTQTFWFRLILTLFSLLTGYMVYERRAEVVAQFSNMISWDGAILYGIAIAIGHVFHELGHAITTKRLGLRVPTMGVIFIVFWPMAYTDISDVWRLTNKWDRLRIGAAGVIAELKLAVIAAFLWCVVPDGGLKVAIYALWSSALMTTLVMNASPLMRFDAYYMLCDLTGIPNLQPRSFALARHALRKFFLGVNEPPPEHVPPEQVLWRIIYAFICWIYRLTVYTGIAVTVYHMAFKLAGICLWFVEVWYFIMSPVIRELLNWPLRHSNKARALIWGAILAALIYALFLPLDRTALAPAVAKDPDSFVIHPTTSGEITGVVATPRLDLPANSIVATIYDSKTAGDLEVVDSEIQSLKLRQTELISAHNMLDNLLPVSQRLDKAVTERQKLMEKIKGQTLYISKDAEVEMADNLRPGSNIGMGTQVAVVRMGQRLAAYGYVAETDINRIQAGNGCIFVNKIGDILSRDCILTAIHSNATKTIEEKSLQSKNGGPIEINQNVKSGDSVDNWYQVTADLGSGRLAMTEPGYLIIDAAPRSPYAVIKAYLIRALRTEATL